MSDEVILIFKATSAELLTGFSKELSSIPSIIYRLEHERRQKVSTAAGVDLTDLKWTMRVHASDRHNDHVDKQGGIGVMSYWDRDGSCHIAVAIGESLFNRLLGAGHIPTQIEVHANGLEYGRDYEGADKIWPQSNKASIVTEVSFSVPMGEVFDEDTNVGAVRKKDVHEIAQQLTKPLYVIVIVVALIGIKLYFH